MESEKHITEKTAWGIRYID